MPRLRVSVMGHTRRLPSPPRCVIFARFLRGTCGAGAGCERIVSAPDSHRVHRAGRVSCSSWSQGWRGGRHKGTEKGTSRKIGLGPHRPCYLENQTGPSGCGTDESQFGWHLALSRDRIWRGRGQPCCGWDANSGLCLRSIGVVIWRLALPMIVGDHIGTSVAPKCSTQHGSKRAQMWPDSAYSTQT